MQPERHPRQSDLRCQATEHRERIPRPHTGALRRPSPPPPRCAAGLRPPGPTRPGTPRHPALPRAPARRGRLPHDRIAPGAPWCAAHPGVRKGIENPAHAGPPGRAHGPEQIPQAHPARPRSKSALVPADPGSLGRQASSHGRRHLQAREEVRLLRHYSHGTHRPRAMGHRGHQRP